MSTTRTKITVLLPLLGLGLAFLPSFEPARTAPVAGNRYIGAKKCKNCHSSSESGDQYSAWMEAKHSKAFETLKSEAAKEFAAKLSLADPASADACLKCHVTGFGEPKEAFARGFDQELGVQCETCHGPGETHMKTRFKAAAKSKSTDYAPVPEGEILVSPPLELCLECHNPESPSYEPFCYFENRGRIGHIDPRKPRTDAEKEAFAKCPSGTPCAHPEGCPDRKCNLTPDELTKMKK